MAGRCSIGHSMLVPDIVDWANKSSEVLSNCADPG